MSDPKVLEFSEAPAVMDRLRAEGKRIVQCHGTFDLLHPGHIYHLEEARDYGDVLVVTITSEQYVNKGPGRPYFNDQLRAKSITALAKVDYVILVPFATAVEAIDCVRPDIYCKGREYADAANDPTGNIKDDIAAVEKWGGTVHYLGSVVFSSSKILNNNFSHLPTQVREICAEMAKTYSPDKVRSFIDDFKTLRVLVIGDLIFDRYSYLKVQGLTSKNRILSGRFLYEETQGGGALAVFNHIKQFTPSVKLAGFCGTDQWTQELIGSHVGREEDLVVRDETFTTIIKQRFVEPNDGDKELNKLFSVNFIEPEPPSQPLQEALLKRITPLLKEVDLVVVADFGHNTLTELLRDEIQEKASYLALNCQTNSNNHGFNIISRQYRRADCFSLDEQELLLSCARRHIDFAHELEKLRNFLEARFAWLTRGAVETIGLGEGEKPFLCLPLESLVRDTVGAGDAFFSVAALAAAKQLPIEISTFLGQLAGAQAVRIVGNSEPISKARLVKSAMTLLNF